MRVWYPCIKESCDLIEPEPEWSIEEDRSFDGRSKLNGWEPPRVVPLDKYVGPEHSDFSKLSGVSGLVTNEKGCKALRPCIKNDVEFLPLAYDDEVVYLMNVTTVLNCLDRTRSDVSYFEDTDEVIYVRRFAFKKDALKGAIIFRVREVPTYGPFVTDEFIEAYKDAGLEGLDFELAWDSAASGEEASSGDASVKEQLPTDGCFDYCGRIDPEVEEGLIGYSKLEQSHLGVSLEGDVSGAIRALTDEVQGLIDGTEGSLRDEDILPISIQLGAMFGEALCKGYGWEWIEVGSGPDDVLYAVASPRHLYCVFPIHFIKKILQGENMGPDGENDNTIMLLYNMLDGIEGTIPDKLLTPVG